MTLLLDRGNFDGFIHDPALARASFLGIHACHMLAPLGSLNSVGGVATEMNGINYVSPRSWLAIDGPMGVTRIADESNDGAVPRHSASRKETFLPVWQASKQRFYELSGTFF